MIKRKCLLSLILSITMIISMVPGMAFAGTVDSNAGGENAANSIIVNNTNLLTSTDNKAACGEGEAIWDESSKTLTLNNATINKECNPEDPMEPESNFGRTLIFCDCDTEITIKLIGKNRINWFDGDNAAGIGIYAKAGAAIKGPGELEIQTGGSAIEVENEWNKDSSIKISDGAKIKIGSQDPAVLNPVNGIILLSPTKEIARNLCIEGNGTEVTVYSKNDSLAAIFGEKEDQYDYGSKCNISIENGAKVSANIAAEYYAPPVIGCDGNINIKDSICNVNSNNSIGIQASEKITIDNSTCNLKTADSAILSVKNAEIKNGAKISAEVLEKYEDGYLPDAVSAWNDMKIHGENTEVKIVSEGVCLFGDNLEIKEANVNVKSNTHVSVFGGTRLSFENSKLEAATLNKETYAIYCRTNDEIYINGQKTEQKEFDSIYISPADYSKVDEAIEGIPDDLSIYTDDTAAAVNAAKDVDRTKNFKEQAAVDKMAADIEEAVKALVRQYKITFTTGEGADEVAQQMIPEGQKIVMPENPKKSGYRFRGWFKDAEFQDEWDFENDIVSADTELFAKWSRVSSGGGSGSVITEPEYNINVPAEVANGRIDISAKSAVKGSEVTVTVTPDKSYAVDFVKVTAKSGSEVAVTAADGKYTFTMPDEDVEIKASFKEEAKPERHAFSDVPENEWYADAVQYVFENKLMNGISEDEFGPDVKTSRAMIVTMLYRMEGEPAADAAKKFGDVAEGQWYADAVNWAASNGIVTGYTDEVFAPDDAISREQMAAILYRYAEFKGYNMNNSADLSIFTDASEIGDWAVDSMKWANANGLINGVNDKEIAPSGAAVRAQVAAIMMRFCEGIAK